MQDAARIAGRYEIVRQIGRGGMARVFLARQTDLDRDVALKEVAGLRQADDTFIRRFFRESRLVGSLQHPNIVTVYEYFEDDGVPYIAMEYLEAGSLRQYVGDLTLVQVAGVLEGVLAGLAHAQARGIVHRDLKPENVMLDDAGRVKIADFGIAKATGDAATTGALTVSGMMIGTPRYMAPEQALSLEIGPWTDLYSVGCHGLRDVDRRSALHRRRDADGAPDAARQPAAGAAACARALRRSGDRGVGRQAARQGPH
jgi:serine/threonine protein kinase